MHPYRIAGYFLGSIALLIIGFLIVGLLLPSGWSAERSIRIEAESEEIFSLISSAEGWGVWTPSPPEGVELFGPEEGVGSGRRWDDEMYGEGEFVLSEILPPNEVAYDVAIEDGSILIRGRIRLESEGEGTLVQWREEGDFGWNPLLGYLAKRMNELQGTQMEASLAVLKSLLEGNEPAQSDLEATDPSESEGSPEGSVPAGESSQVPAL